jgi:hypothetical protein
LFKDNPHLLDFPYSVQSIVPLPAFQDFVSALLGRGLEVTAANFAGLQRLSEEFGFTDLELELSTFKQSTGLFPPLQGGLLSESFDFILNGTVIRTDIAKAALLSPAVRAQLSVDGCARQFVLDDGRITLPDLHALGCFLSGEVIAGAHSLALLCRRLGHAALEPYFVGGAAALLDGPSDWWAHAGSIDVSVEALDCLLSSESVSVPSEDALLEFVLKLGSDYRGLLRHIQMRFLSAGAFFLLLKQFGLPSESVWEWVARWFANLLDSQIIPFVPEIFHGLLGRRFEIRWRDGFDAKEFHRRCDGRGNTLTVILDTEGNVFGGFTPAKWESSERDYAKADQSLKSFVFSLKNPGSVLARMFELKKERKHQAIVCNSDWGPHFSDIVVSNRCNANSKSNTYLGLAYNNDTGVVGYKFFTGSQSFQVKEIEVFEMIG